MNVNRRQFLRGSAAVVVAPMLPTVAADEYVTLVDMPYTPIAPVAIDFKGGSLARLLQEGIHKVFTESLGQYEMHPMLAGRGLK